MKKTLAAIIATIILLSQALPLAWAWQIERPHRDIDILDLVENCNTNNEASVGLGVWVDDYDENAGEYGADYVAMNVSMTANSRMGITYKAPWEDLWWFDEENYVVDYYNEYSNVGFHWGTWVDFPPYLTFRFWGGHNSAEYKRVWVCSNGFVCFDLSESTTHVEQAIPSTATPNALIAGVWTGLFIDADAKITTYRVFSCLFSAFVITWENVLTADQKRLTFQIVLENAPSDYVAPYYPQSRIWINYKSVSSIYDDFTYGIEDHEGLRGYGGLKSGYELASFNQGTMYLQQISSGFFIKRLKLEFKDAEAQTRYRIMKENDFIRGYHVRFDPDMPDPEPDSYKIFANTLDTGSLLVSLGGVLLNVGTFGVTFPVSCILVAKAWRDYLAESYYNSIEKLELMDSFTDPPSPDRASITVPAQDYVVDTALGLVFHWILDTENSVGHSLTITAKVEYCEQSVDGTIIDKDLTTSVTLNINPDDNDSFDDADTIQTGSYSWLYIDYIYDRDDYYKISVTPGKTVLVKMTPPPNRDYNLYLYDQNRELVDKSELGTGITESVVGKGECYIKVNATSAEGWYSLEVEEVEDLYDDDFLEGWSCSGGQKGGRTFIIWGWPEGGVMTKSWTFNSEVLEFVTVSCYSLLADSWRFEAHASDGTWFYGSNSSNAETKTWVITDWYTGEIDKVGIRVFGADGDQASFSYIAITSAVTLTITTGFGGTTDPSPGTHEYLEKTSAQVTAIPNTNYYFMYWRLDGQRVNSNPITVTTDSDHTLNAYFSGGGGCPALFVWNGSDYVDYGVINIHDVENDVIREVPVQTEDMDVVHYKVKFRLREGWLGLNYSHSLIDQVKLYAVDSEGNRYLCPLIKAEHSEQGRVLLNLLFSDDYRIDTYLMDTIDLTFIMPYPTETIENFTFIIEGHNPLKL